MSCSSTCTILYYSTHRMMNDNNAGSASSFHTHRTSSTNRYLHIYYHRAQFLFYIFSFNKMGSRILSLYLAPIFLFHSTYNARPTPFLHSERKLEISYASLNNCLGHSLEWWSGANCPAIESWASTSTFTRMLYISHTLMQHVAIQQSRRHHDYFFLHVSQENL